VTTPSAELIFGDSVEVMSKIEDESVHSVLTDPDYGIASNTGRQYRTHKRQFSGWETPYGAQALTDYTRSWAAQALRICTPGAFLLAFGADRTIHRVTAGLEDAGWEIKSMWVWKHDQGQPLGTNLRSGGWSTRLRPLFEPITVARKPVRKLFTKPKRTLILDNFDHYGTGLLNIDTLRAADGQWPGTVFQCPKPRGECPDDRESAGPGGHTTIKPLRLGRQLVRAITPVGGTCIDMHMGTGTFIEAGLNEGFNMIGIDRVQRFVNLSGMRVARARAGNSPYS
jgi:DNA modification methylase